MFGNLLEEGVEPGAALKATQDAFVDYDLQGHVDEWLRQIIPFLRFEISTVPKVLSQAHRPLVRQPVQAGRAEAERQDQGLAPFEARRGFGVPLGVGQYLTGLGSVQQATDQATRQALPLPGRPYQTHGRQALGKLTPLVRPGIEAATGTELFSGRRFGQGRHLPPGMLRNMLEIGGATKRQRTSRGRKTVTRPGFEVAASVLPLPGGRLYSVLRKGATKGLTAGTAQAMFGLRLEETNRRQESYRLLQSYLEYRANHGDVGLFQRIYELGRPDAELRQAHRAYKRILKRRR
jgi:hypothetical protein